ncbi:DUF4309 domain-containing protein [Shimazuella kribbensis]|uniref:DUF4309 domain-containing protein n=1 Tax=Shimazuella kribbensis TaxID=139808 RepID=UPI000412FD37|nr:DUF4309 domain-containing protein [Shimazuella kribbensis]
MKKMFGTILFLAVFCLIISGCTINLSANDNQQNTNANLIQIKVNFYAEYGDSFELQIELDNAQTAKGTWTIKSCSGEIVQKDKDTPVLVGYQKGGCEWDNKTIYINFTGIANGKQISLDKIHELDYKELETAPRNEATLSMGWNNLKIKAQEGYLVNTSAHLGASKEDILTHMGDPDMVDDENDLVYKDLIIAFNKNQKVSFLSFKNPNISSSIEEIEQVFGKSEKIDASFDGVFWLSYILGAYELNIWFDSESKITEINLMPSYR